MYSTSPPKKTQNKNKKTKQRKNTEGEEKGKRT
jgi:hypothetical protein